MALLSQKITGLFDGISQQAASDRFPRQCEDQENCFSTVSMGAGKRPPLEYVSLVSGTPFSRAYFHTINRDLNERYTVVVTDGDLQVFDAETGEAKVVGFPDGTGYLNVVDARHDFSMTTVADFTFIVNKRVSPQVDPNKTAPGSITGRKQEFNDVETIDSPSNGDIYEVAGNQRNAFGQYYVRRSGGVWKEVAQPGVVNGFDHSTMPHALRRNADGTFTFKQIDWEVMDVGDDNTNPRPSFIDQTISDVFFFRNRLGFISGDNVLMSRSGGYFNLWRETATDLLDTDPIDTAVTGTQVTTLHHAVPFKDSLMLFSGQQQFSLSGGQVLNPKTVTVTPSTSFEASTKVRPVGLGPSVYFPVPAGNFTTMREYYVEANSVGNNATDVTAHVPRLIPKNLVGLAAATNEDMLFVQPESPADQLYVYRMHWSNDKKVQSAWGKWTFPGDVINAVVLDNRLMVLLERADGVHLCQINLRPDQRTGDLGFLVHLDMRETVTGSYESVDDETRFEISYEAADADNMELVMDSGAGQDAGKTFPLRRLGPTLYAIDGDYQGVTGYVGAPYKQSYTFSQFYYRQHDDSVTTARLQMRRMWLAILRTGYFTVKVTRPDGVARTMSVAPGFAQTNGGRLIGAADWTLDDVVIGDGEVLLPVRGNNRQMEVTLENDTPYPSHFVSAEWEGEFNPEHRLS